MLRSTATAWVWGVLAGLALLGSGCDRSDEPCQAEGLTVFAAASTTDAMQEVAQAFCRCHPTWKVQLSFASSSTLARQIEQGAQADVYVSANPKWMDYLAQRGLIQTQTRRDLLANRLALIGPEGAAGAATLDPDFDLPASFPGRLAVGDVSHVPAGMYARQALESFGWWETLSSRLASAADVRGALRFVQTGQALRGIVYTTDAAACPDVAVLAVFPESSHSPIRYPAAAVACDGEGARAFLAFLSGPEAAEILGRNGFEVLREGP